MKLTPRLRLVKPTAPPLTIAVLASALASLLTVVSMLWIWTATDNNGERVDQYGASLAAGFAELAVEPLLKQDRMQLAVISNRLQATPDVTGVSVFSVDNQLLATSGDYQSGLRYSHPVTFDEGIMGYVRVTLDPETMVAPLDPLRITLALATLLVAPTLCVGLLCMRVVRGTQPAAVTDVDLPDFGEPTQHYLLAINLYNQLGMTPEQRQAELADAQAIAQQVSQIYAANVRELPGTGLLVHFPDSGDHDRGLQALCAAFVVAHLLEQAAGVYRLGLHIMELPQGGDLPEQAPEIADVALLSALAKHMTLAVSDRFPVRLLQQDRVECYPLDNPLLDEIGTTQGRGYLITSLSPAHQALVAQQVARFASKVNHA